MAFKRSKMGSRVPPRSADLQRPSGRGLRNFWGRGLSNFARCQSIRGHVATQSGLRAHLGTQNRSKLLFFIPLEIDIEGIPKCPQTPFLGDFDASLLIVGGRTPQFLSLFGPIKGPKDAKMGKIWAKKGFPRCLMQHVNAGKVHLCTLPARNSDFF